MITLKVLDLKNETKMILYQVSSNPEDYPKKYRFLLDLVYFVTLIVQGIGVSEIAELYTYHFSNLTKDLHLPLITTVG